MDCITGESGQMLLGDKGNRSNINTEFISIVKVTHLAALCGPGPDVVLKQVIEQVLTPVGRLDLRGQ